MAILNSLNAHYLLIFQPILMILVSKFMVYRALSDKTYLLLGLLSPLTERLLMGRKESNQTNKQKCPISVDEMKPLTLCVLVSSAFNFANSLDPDQAHKTSGLIWIQTVCHSDGIPERIFRKS